MKKMPITYSIDMKKIIIALYVIFNLFIATIVFAEISVGTILTYKYNSNEESNLINQPSVIKDAAGRVLPTKSGLQLFAGDSVKSYEEELILLVPASSMVLSMSAYSEIGINVLDLGGREYVLQITTYYGSIVAEVHNTSDLLQVLVDIEDPPVYPNVIERPDKFRNTSANAFSLYTQIINVDASLESKNLSLDIASGVFITGEDTNIKVLIDTLKQSRNLNERLSAILTFPSTKPELFWNQQLVFTSYFYNFIDFQMVLGEYRVDFKKNKFKADLNIPLFLTRNNLFYNPFGTNDWLFGSGIWHKDYEEFDSRAKSILSIEQAGVSVLKKIKSLSYGTPEDIIYLYYGEQEKWANPRSTLFFYNYKPFKTTPNNFNEDLILYANFNRIGFDFRLRQFQNESYLTSLAATPDVFYNRFWIRPVLPSNDMELGITFAGDLSLAKYSQNGAEETTIVEDVFNRKVYFFGLDMSFPLMTSRLYELELNVETGTMVPVTKDGYISHKPDAGLFSDILGENATIPSAVAKIGTRHTFIDYRNERYAGLGVNAYAGIGSAKPHFMNAGYEYANRYLYNQNLSVLLSDTTAKEFANITYTPEIEYFVKSPSIDFSSGLNVPLTLNDNKLTLNDNNLNQDTSLFVDMKLNADTYLPTPIGLSFNLFYAITALNYSDLASNLFSFDVLDTLDSSFGFLYNTLDVSLDMSIFDVMNVSAGLFNTPKYVDTELDYYEDSGRPAMIMLPYFSIGASHGQKLFQQQP